MYIIEVIEVATALISSRELQNDIARIKAEVSHYNLQMQQYFQPQINSTNSSNTFNFLKLPLISVCQLPTFTVSLSTLDRKSSAKKALYFP